jgi:hypothetical protein
MGICILCVVVFSGCIILPQDAVETSTGASLTRRLSIVHNAAYLEIRQVTAISI